MNRREFLTLSATAAVGIALASNLRAENTPTPVQTPRIPRRRGFNLPELSGGKVHRSYRESDFEWMATWGFDFARLPMSYWTWSSRSNWTVIEEKALAPVDTAIEWGRQHRIHVNLNFHRIPGYCVNGRELEPFLLFDAPQESMDKALDAAVVHWRYFAKRYKGIPSDRLSFDLLNEPPFMSDRSRYVEVIRALVKAIREEDPDRLIVIDGADIGQTPVPEVIDLRLVQSTRGYLPKMVSHYTAGWVPKNEFESFEKPAWPMVDAKGQTWNREKLRQELIAKWQPLMDRGVSIHVGEWGCLNRTPHGVMLAWMHDLLSLWKEANWGWALWNLRGNFGVVDSERSDVKYEKFDGHKLDRQMLELLLQN